MLRNIFLSLIFLIPMNLFGENEVYDTLSITPIGVDYSKYAGMDKLFMVGECEGMTGNQVVVFQNRPSFDFFEADQTYGDEQKELEQAIWEEILDKDTEPIVLKGRWHSFNNRMIFLSHQILKINTIHPVGQ